MKLHKKLNKLWDETKRTRSIFYMEKKTRNEIIPILSRIVLQNPWKHSLHISQDINSFKKCIGKEKELIGMRNEGWILEQIVEIKKEFMYASLQHFIWCWPKLYQIFVAFDRNMTKLILFNFRFLNLFQHYTLVINFTKF